MTGKEFSPTKRTIARVSKIHRMNRTQIPATSTRMKRTMRSLRSARSAALRRSWIRFPKTRAMRSNTMERVLSTMKKTTMTRMTLRRQPRTSRRTPQRKRRPRPRPPSPIKPSESKMDFLHTEPPLIFSSEKRPHLFLVTETSTDGYIHIDHQSKRENR